MRPVRASNRCPARTNVTRTSRTGSCADNVARLARTTANLPNPESLVLDIFLRRLCDVQPPPHRRNFNAAETTFEKPATFVDPASGTFLASRRRYNERNAWEGSREAGRSWREAHLRRLRAVS